MEGEDVAEVDSAGGNATGIDNAEVDAFMTHSVQRCPEWGANLRGGTWMIVAAKVGFLLA